MTKKSRDRRIIIRMYFGKQVTNIQNKSGKKLSDLSDNELSQYLIKQD